MNTETVEAIVNQLPVIMNYFVEGYIFLAIYRFIAFKQEKSTEKYSLLKSVVVSAVIKSIFDCIPVTAKLDNFYTPVLCLICAILGFLCGKLIRNKMLNNILSFLKIQRTPNENIWDDVIKDGQNCWVCLRSPKIDNLRYLGVFRYGEEFKSEPIIALSNYQILDANGKVLADYSNTNDMIMLNTKDFEVIEITYEDVENEESNIVSEQTTPTELVANND